MSDYIWNALFWMDEENPMHKKVKERVFKYIKEIVQELQGGTV